MMVCFAPPLSAEEKAVDEPESWGIAIGIRSAAIPYATGEDRVNDAIPLIFYEKGRVFINGLEAGFKLYETDQWRISALGRYRYFDIPAEYQNEIRGNSFDLGGQVRRYFSDTFNADLEVLSDSDGRLFANATVNFPYTAGDLELLPSATLRIKSSRFNNTYYGLNEASPGSGFDLKAGVNARYQVYKTLHLVGRAGLILLDDSTYDTDVIDSRLQGEFYLGFGFFKDKTEKTDKKLSSKRYLRVAHGWATPSSLGKIITGNAEKDPYNNQMTSLFYGQPVSDHLFGLPIPLYLTPGIVRHHSSEVQPISTEFVLAMKAYYTFRWPVTWRLGVAEGLSYVDRVPYVEQSNMDRKDYRASRLLNFLDFSLDIELGDLFRSGQLDGLWLGYSIHHRSGIFETSSAFGRIGGGSNINTVYLQYHW
jgi:outer membrane protein